MKIQLLISKGESTFIKRGPVHPLNCVLNLIVKTTLIMKSDKEIMKFKNGSVLILRIMAWCLLELGEDPATNVMKKLEITCNGFIPTIINEW